ncbi:MAG TPA: TetR-like C-terminal domain-containing protein [Ktedonobacterales bacterium]|jgi:AcrR family transcriptional regulator
MARSEPRPGLDEAAVLRAAAEIIDAEGARALSLARLAAVLGVRPPSLYNHVDGLDGVWRGLAVMGVRALRDRLTRVAIGRSGEEAMVALAAAYRAFAKEHPGLYAASLRAPGPGEDALAAASEETLAILRAVLAPYGLGAEAEVHALRAFRSVAHGFVSLELAGGFGLPVALDASYQALVRLLVAGLAHSAQSNAGQSE